MSAQPFLLQNQQKLSGAFDLLITIRRLKFAIPLSKDQQARQYTLKFANQKRVQVPQVCETKESSKKDLICVNFGGTGTCGLSLQLTESMNKIPIELSRSNPSVLSLQPDESIWCSNQCSIRKLHQVGGTIKSEVRLYENPDSDQKKHICSLFLELEKRGGRPTPISQKKKQIQNIVQSLVEYDFETLEQICELVKKQGYQRLSPDQQKMLAEAEPVIIKPTVWHDHVGIKENIELVKITELCYGIICNIELYVVPWNHFCDLVMIKDTNLTLVFLLITTLFILWFEICFPLLLVLAAFKLLFILYRHESYVQKPPDVKANIAYIKWVSELFQTLKYQLELFLVDVVYWRDTRKSVKLVAWLIIFAFLSFIGLNIIGIRLIMIFALYSVTAYHSRFCCDLAKVVCQVIGEWDLHPVEEWVYLKIEKIFMYIVQLNQTFFRVLDLVTCRTIREKYLNKLQIKKNQDSSKNEVGQANLVLDASLEVEKLAKQEQEEENDFFAFSEDEDVKQPKYEIIVNDTECQEIEMETYENERWWIGNGWCNKMLPQERSSWSDLSGHLTLPRDTVRLPDPSWKWTTGWQIQRCTRKYQKDRPGVPVDHDGTYDQEGWQYSIDWNANFSGQKSISSVVRRRKWVRTCINDKKKEQREGSAKRTNDSDSKRVESGRSSLQLKLNEEKKDSSQSRSPQLRGSNQLILQSNQLSNDNVQNPFNQGLAYNPFNPNSKEQKESALSSTKILSTSINQKYSKAVESLDDASQVAKAVSNLTKNAISGFFKKND